MPSEGILSQVNDYLYQHNRLKIDNHNFQYLLIRWGIPISRKIALSPKIDRVCLQKPLLVRQHVEG